MKNWIKRNWRKVVGMGILLSVPFSVLTLCLWGVGFNFLYSLLITTCAFAVAGILVFLMLLSIQLITHDD
jgi:hypothetical protein